MKIPRLHTQITKWSTNCDAAVQRAIPFRHHLVRIQKPVHINVASLVITLCAFISTSLPVHGENTSKMQHTPKMLQTIMETAPAGIGMVENRVMVMVNEYILDLTGYEESEILGQSARMLYPTQEESEYVGTEKYRQIAEKGTGRVETRWQRKDGKIRNIILSSTPLNPNDLSEGVVFTALDITARKEAKQEILRQQQFQDALLRAIPVAVFYKDRHGRYLGSNDYFSEITGVSSEELVGKTVFDLWPGEMAQQYHQADLDLMDEPAHQIYESTVRDAEGENRPVIFGKKVFHDIDGDVAGLVGAFVDMSQQAALTQSLIRRTWIFMTFAAGISLVLLLLVFRLRRSMKQLKSTTDELESFFSVNLDLLCIADMEGNFIKTNEAWSRILGYSTEELNNRKFLEFVHPDDMDATLGAMAKLGKGDDVLEFTNRYKCKDGSYRFIEWRAHPKGNVIYAAARDVTDQKRAKEELHKKTPSYTPLLIPLPIPLL
ncbi:PAS domain-containing protein [Chitinivibrio alkaliphilus]|uniref:PAS-domains containing protein n=1 Tax=Chitinivibrio alkaliphilus ACht1 TaxID=1313304 RepID=U7D5P6_9BACT|nr:PAS domain S-box protein [Chitinivibrio alkaliphilus]ERP30866.1 PAS-domains containing protein [Chitinivibrio alkaliphilus ACht1]